MQRNVESDRTRIEEIEFEGRSSIVVSYAPLRPGILATLTASELEVVELWMQGASMKDIGAARTVSTRTVANQLASVYRKLRVSSRSELFERFRRCQLQEIA